MLTQTLFDARGANVRDLTELEVNGISAVIMREFLDRPTYGGDMPMAMADATPYASMIAGRLALAGALKFSPNVVRACAVLTDRPAAAVIWAYSLVRHQRQTNTYIDMEEWSRLLHAGVPTIEFIHTLWLQQKFVGAPNSNRLDLMTAWQ